MPFLIITFVFLLIVLFIVEPLLKGRRRIASRVESSLLIAEKERIYSLLKDLDSDLQSSKISEEDYNLLRSQYMNQTIKIMKEIEDLPKRKRTHNLTHDEKIDQLIQQERMRKKKTKK